MDQIEEKIKKMSILVIDDMESIRSMVNSCLKEMGVNTVIMACNAESAWKTLTTEPIDMIICDWDMPEVTGIDLLKRVRGSEKHKHLPFLLLTATREKEKVLNAISAGVNDYLTKPFQTKELKYRVIKLLRKVKP